MVVFFYRVLIIYCLSINFLNASGIERDYVSRLKMFTQVWEELENYRTWTAARLESLDVNDQWGRVSEERISEVKSEVPSSALKTTRMAMKGRDAYAFCYFAQVQDRLLDYYVSEAIVESTEILFQHSQKGEITEALASRVKGDILGVINASLITFIHAAKIKMALGCQEDPAFLTLLTKIGAFVYGDSSAYPAFFQELSEEEEKLLSESEEGENNLFCGKLLSKIMVLLESAFPTPEVSGASSSSVALVPHLLQALLRAGDVQESSLFSFARSYFDTYGVLSSVSRSEGNPKLHNKFLKRFLEMGKFKFSEMEGDIRTSIRGFLDERYGGLVTLKTPEKPKAPKKSVAAKKTSRTKSKGKGKGKGKSKHQKQKTPAQELSKEPSQGILESADSSPVAIIDSGEGDVSEEKNLAEFVAETEGDVDEMEDVAEAYVFDFNEWYQTEVTSRILPADASDEDEDGPGAKVLASSDALPRFVFNDKARAFYQAVMGSPERPVFKRDFDALLRDVGGGYGRESKSGSAVTYWLPNLSDTRVRNPYLRFTVHVPHNGSDAFPFKTLKYFLQRAFVRCEIYKGLSS